jgi:hypothetical protein
MTLICANKYLFYFGACLDLDVRAFYSPKTRIAQSKCCENDLYIMLKLEANLDILNQNPVVMIARIFNMLPVPER